MSIEAGSITVTTSRIAEVRAFYQDHFDARTLFDCGWYVVLQLGQQPAAPELCLMQPQEGMPEFSGGITLNLQVADVDIVYKRLTSARLEPVVALEDHPWGDRGFGVADPAGMLVYCYRPTEPAPAFKQYVIAQP